MERQEAVDALIEMLGRRRKERRKKEERSPSDLSFSVIHPEAASAGGSLSIKSCSPNNILFTELQDVILEIKACF